MHFIYLCIFQINYKISNVFSEHDNRHSFQDHGVYFGDVSIQYASRHKCACVWVEKKGGAHLVYKLLKLRSLMEFHFFVRCPANI